MTLTNEMHRNGERAVAEMSERAKWFYNNSDPLHIYADTFYGWNDDGDECQETRFFIRGGFGNYDDLAFSDVWAFLENEYYTYTMTEDGYETLKEMATSPKATNIDADLLNKWIDRFGNK